MSRLTNWLRPTTVAHAHCDIPCGIYDPSEGVQAARTVARMVELIGTLPDRATAVFEPAHLASFPDPHTQVWNLLKLAGKNKPGVEAQAAADLEVATKEFADMFWATRE